jgi:hypothetical protein
VFFSSYCSSQLLFAVPECFDVPYNNKPVNKSAMHYGPLCLQEVCLDALPDELMQSISNIIQQEIPDIIILAERLTLPPDTGESSGTLCQMS